MSITATNSLNNVQAPVNYRAKKAEQVPVTKTETINANSLDNPIEIVGRSQVNFKGKRIIMNESEFLEYLRTNILPKRTKEEIMGQKAINTILNNIVEDLNNCKISNREAIEKLYKLLESFKN